MLVKCQEGNSALKGCLTADYNDAAFDEEYKLDHLKERRGFR